MKDRNILQVVFTGLVSFIATYVVMLILAAILDAVGVEKAADVVTDLSFLVALLAGLIAAYDRYSKPRV